ncbi:dihydrofolate reductase family protein [Candidatus Woesearchaeota archaeon]|nr:dihydrofolate reductase family protein [Candidatus Woesearchaeota archaeon]
MVRKIILNMAISLDGYIADPKGGFDCIIVDGYSSNDTTNKFNFDEFLYSIDIIVMGENAFLDSPKEGMDMFKEKNIYVASNEELDTEYKNATFIKGDIVSQVIKLKENEGKDIWIYGGGILVDYFIKENVIDEYIIAIIPIILGKGRPLFLEDNPTLKLHLEETTTQDGIVVLKYKKR